MPRPPFRPRRVDQPRPGYFLVRLLKGGARAPARIFMEYGQFVAEIDGKRQGAAHADPIRADGVMRIWEFGQEITRDEYDRALGDPNRPDPTRKLDLNREKPEF